jgi:hypothetical protein
MTYLKTILISALLGFLLFSVQALYREEIKKVEIKKPAPEAESVKVSPVEKVIKQEEVRPILKTETKKAVSYTNKPTVINRVIDKNCSDLLTLIKKEKSELSYITMMRGLPESFSYMDDYARLLTDRNLAMTIGSGLYRRDPEFSPEQDREVRDVADQFYNQRLAEVGQLASKEWGIKKKIQYYKDLKCSPEYK